MSTLWTCKHLHTAGAAASTLLVLVVVVLLLPLFS
jgi:hypothetical protein